MRKKAARKSHTSRNRGVVRNYETYEKRINNYFEKHPVYNSFLHAIGGIGLGMIIASLIGVSYLLLWGVILLAIYVAGHIYAHNHRG